MSWRGKGGGLRKRPWERDPDLSFWDPLHPCWLFRGAAAPLREQQVGKAAAGAPGAAFPRLPCSPEVLYLNQYFPV